MLTEPQLTQYRDEGYTLLGPILSDDDLTMLRAEEARFRKPIGADEITIFRSQVAHYSEGVRRLATQGRCVAFARTLVGADALCLFFNQFVTKLPDGDSGKSIFPWHQDNGYVSLEPATNVTIWIALDDVNTENGCVYVLPESHKKGLLSHKSKSPDSWHLEVPVSGEGVPAILKAGEAIAFTGLTLHRSLLNHTDRPRRAFFLEYADAAATQQEGNGPKTPLTADGQTWLVAGQLPWPPARP